MTQTTKEVFEKHEIRKTKRQKSAFIDYVISVATGQGYSCTTEQGSMGARNIVVGSPDKAKIVYTAHYDTCAVMPFPNFITPKNFLIYLLYQLVIVLFIYVPVFAAVYLSYVICAFAGVSEGVALLVGEIVLFVGMFLMLWLIAAGPANKHTANDNTSGVTTLLDIMCALPEEKRDEVAFVFFDLEEMGLFGSKGFANQHKQTMKDKLLINFDCVSDGDHMLFVLKKGAMVHAAAIERAFPSDETYTVEIATKGVFYPSDQANFPCGVGVAALNKTKRGNLLYMNRIHTKHDTVYHEKNIEFFVQGAVRLVCEMDEA
jgi:hypothetical protein